MRKAEGEASQLMQEVSETRGAPASRIRGNHMKSHVVRKALFALLCAGAANCVSAQAYPTKPVRLIVPFAPGGSNDTMSRALAQKLTERWNQQVIVDNRGGAGGNIGTEIAVRATPDGYTLLMGSSQLAVNPSLYAKLPFSAQKDLAPISLVASTVYVLSLNPAVPATSVKELIALAKSKPRQLNYASGGAGSPLHMSAELFKIMTGAEMVHVPYKGGAPAVSAVLAGETQLIFGNTTTVLPHVRSNRLRALGVTSAQRSRLFPELPTIAEAGVPGYELINWYGVMAPAGTPQPIIAKINSEFAAVVKSPDASERMASQSTEPNTSTPEEFRAYLKSETTKWAGLIKSADLKAQ